jgi:hypothetical protein
MFVVGARAAENKAESKRDYLKVVTAYADTLIEHGRDTYGKVHSPLFAAALDRKQLTIEGVESAEGVRPEDSAVGGANPMHDQNLYQILYALTEITGEKKYAAEADKALKYFFEHCQHPISGLMAWGEHMSWDLTKDAVQSQGYDDPYHEFFRPWVLWERCFKLTPEACTRFAKGLWNHQIYDQNDGNFNRHAFFDGKRHTARRGRRDGYPRHGGFYIRTWAEAYRATKDPVYVHAIETLIGHFNGRRHAWKGLAKGTDAIRLSQTSYGVWTGSNLSLAIDLGYGAELVPDETMEKMRDCASRTDKAFLSVIADEQAVGYTYVGKGKKLWSVWSAHFGSQGGASVVGNMCLARFRQVGLDGYKKLIRHIGDLYVGNELPESITPDQFGSVVLLMVGCHELLGDEKYLREADHFAALSIDLFLTDGSPLPCATTEETHYEAIAQGDTMMMALLKLWLTHNKPDLEVDLVYTDR